jgi:hypothetical protein
MSLVCVFFLPFFSSSSSFPDSFFCYRSVTSSYVSPSFSTHSTADPPSRPSQEVAYVYSVPNEYKTANTLGNRTGDAELAHLVTSQWISFIHDSDPNNHGGTSSFSSFLPSSLLAAALPSLLLTLPRTSLTSSTPPYSRRRPRLARLPH